MKDVEWTCKKRGWESLNIYSVTHTKFSYENRVLNPPMAYVHESEQQQENIWVEPRYTGRTRERIRWTCQDCKYAEDLPCKDQAEHPEQSEGKRADEG